MIRRSMTDEKEEEAKEDNWEIAARLFHRPELAKLKGKVKWTKAMSFVIKNDF